MPFSKDKRMFPCCFIQNPLQVRNSIQSDFGKKAFLSAPAAMTLEAAMVLTLFLFACVCLILPMKVLNTERRIQAGLEAVGEDFSRYAYILDILQQDGEPAVPGADAFARGFCHYLVAGAAENYAQTQALAYADTNNLLKATMKRSQILEDGETFDLILDYQIQLPFPVLGLSGIERTARCRRRAWIGIAGKDGGTGASSGKEEDELVYIGKNSTRYHRQRSCHYISNDLSAVSYGEVSSLRNKNGGKYYPCSVCGKGAGSNSTVYILPSGSSFHTSKQCTAINAYVQVVPLSQVIHLGACSYCSGG